MLPVVLPAALDLAGQRGVVPERQRFGVARRGCEVSVLMSFSWKSARKPEDPSARGHEGSPRRCSDLRRGGVGKSTGHTHQGNAAAGGPTSGFAYPGRRARHRPPRRRLAARARRAGPGRGRRARRAVGAAAQPLGRRPHGGHAGVGDPVRGGQPGGRGAGRGGGRDRGRRRRVPAGRRRRRPQLGRADDKPARGAGDDGRRRAGGEPGGGAHPAPAPFAASCGGACAGCDLVEGCRDASPSP